MKRVLAVLAVTVSLLLLSIIAAPKPAEALVAENCDTSSFFLGFPTWYKYLDVGQEVKVVDGATNVVDECAINGPKGADGKLDSQAVIGRVALAIVEILLRLSGLIAVAFVVYGGFNYITSQGEPEKTKSARQTIVNAVIGVVIATIATVIVAFIGREFTK